MTTKEIEIQLALGTLPRGDRIKLSGNKRISKKILTILSKDKDWNVRYNVAYNPNTPIEVRKHLYTDDGQYRGCIDTP